MDGALSSDLEGALRGALAAWKQIGLQAGVAKEQSESALRHPDGCVRQGLRPWNPKPLCDLPKAKDVP